MRGRGFTLAAGIALACGPAALAGPWPQAPGTYYLKLSGAVLVADELYTSEGEALDIPTYRRHEIDLYLQAPISQRWTFLAAVPVYRWSEIEGFDEAGGVGDVAAGVQVLLARRGEWLFAARAAIQAPTGDETKGQGILPTGSGVWEGEALLSLGRGFGRGYGFVEAGHRLRGSGFQDSFVYRGELGGRLGERWLLAARVWGQDTRPAGDDEIGSPAGFGDGVSHLSAGPSITVDLADRWAIQLEVDHPLDGENLARGTTFRLGLIRSR